ncbi:MAG: lipocalin-like domain-containing protein [Verrucomicrobiota bacterium]
MRGPFVMISVRKFLFLLLLVPSLACSGEWRLALPGWEYEFPRDHYDHPEFKTEWWYITGNLEAEDGRQLGFQWTLFRQGVRPPGGELVTSSEFVNDSFYFAHCAVSDITAKKFRYEQLVSRGAFDEAGVHGAPHESGKIGWIGDWGIWHGEPVDGDESFSITGAAEDAELDLKFISRKAPVINGTTGCSQKADGAGNATHYYSLTRLETSGTVTIDGKVHRVSGWSWKDREWGSNQLTENQTGWDWFSIHFDDGSDLMLYQLRTVDGGTDPNSSGSYTDSKGVKTHLTRDDFTLTPLRKWKSEETEGEYPVEWKISVPKFGIEATSKAEFDAQELALPIIAYWEGAIEVVGTKNGEGYLELSGYAGSLGGLK